MKFLDLPEMRHVNAVLSQADLGDVVVEGALEAYSCKAVKDDHKLMSKKQAEVAQLKKSMGSPKLSPVILCTKAASPTAMESPLGPIDTSATLKLLVNLISTLNNSFPDYEFSDVEANDFKQESISSVVDTIDHLLLNASLEKKCPGFRARFWKAVDKAVVPSQCEVYQYIPCDDSDLCVGKLWTMFYFFYNRRKSRIVLLACTAMNKMRTPQFHGVGMASVDMDSDVYDDFADEEFSLASPGMQLDDGSKDVYMVY